MVISIIVMLILAGVSISAIVGEDGLLTKAQQASFANKLATYNEEFEMNAVGAITDAGVDNRNKITLMNEYVKQYVPSLEDNDIGQFAIINGQLYYVGDEDLEREVCKSQGYNTLPEGMTAEEFASSVESSAIEEILKNMTGDAFTSTDDEGNTQTLGVQLVDKTFSNGNKWKIITEVENGENKATYGTEWYYVEAGQNVEGIGILKNSYIINYATRKAVKFDANKHTMLAYGSNLAVSENLLLNVDASIIDNNNLEKALSGVNINGYEYQSQITNGYSFVFDGQDDYISMKIDNNNSIRNGYTLDLSFIVKGIGKTVYYSDKVNNIREEYNGLFSARALDETRNNNFRFGFGDMNDNKFCIIYNPCFSDIQLETEGKVMFDSTKYSTKNRIVFYKELSYNEDYAISITFDIQNKIEKIYMNGICVGKVFLTDEYCNEYQQYIDTREIYNFGRSSFGSNYTDHYFNGNLYWLHFYNRALSDEEMLVNYNASVGYKNILINNSNASTGGNTGGEDIGTIE